MKYTYITDYKDNDNLRKSFNELTERTYGFNFEEWYLDGFWKDKYIPYSIVHNEKVIANVSVNIMNFNMDGIEKHYIQLGTVMTDKEYRGHGLSRYLIEKIIDEYKDKTDGIYLFANDSVLNFYPKFGFVKGTEYQYSKNVDFMNGIKKIEHIDMTDKRSRESLIKAVDESVSNGRFTVDNPDLIAFWVTGWRSDLVYYLPEGDTYVIAEVKEKNVFIHQIIANHNRVNLDIVISSFGSGTKKVILGFTPYVTNGFKEEELHEGDCTLFILGKDLQNIENKKIMFPTLSHA